MERSKKKFYKDLGRSVKDIRNHKDEKKKRKQNFIDKVKKPFKIISNYKNIDPEEKVSLLETMIVIVSSILGVSVIGFLIANSFKDDHVQGKGREIYEKILGSKSPPLEKIIPLGTPSTTETESYGVGYNPERYQRSGLRDYPDERGQHILKKLGLPIKWFSKSTQ